MDRQLSDFEKEQIQKLDQASHALCCVLQEHGVTTPRNGTLSVYIRDGKFTRFTVEQSVITDAQTKLFRFEAKGAR